MRVIVIQQMIITFFYGSHLGLGFFIHQGHGSVKRTTLINDMMLCIIQRGRQCNFIVLNVSEPLRLKVII